MPFKFIYICNLLERLEELELHDLDVALPKADKETRYRGTVEDWFRSHRRLIDGPETDRAALLSTLFPERRTDRVYFLQPLGLLKLLCRCLGFGAERLERLKSWALSSHEDLAVWVTNLVRATDAGMAPSNLTVEEIDATLERVAARCRHSSPQVRQKAFTSGTASADVLLKPLIHRLPSYELKWFLRLVLKKFQPVILEEGIILGHVHFLLPRLLRFQCNFGAATDLLSGPVLRHLPPRPDPQTADTLISEISSSCFKPRIGVKIGRPTFIKGRSIQNCFRLVKNARWAVEPKFDGEYCQVHIDLSRGLRNCIQIFAKSGKDATRDRKSLHDGIRQSLRIGKPSCAFKHSCILEGEMVVYDGKTKSISAFHKIRKHVSRSGLYLGTEDDSQVHSHEQLMLIFFDALLIDDEITMAAPYSERRRQLKNVALHLEGHVHRIDWGMIDFSKLSERRAVEKIQKQFAKAICRRWEGLVMKPYDGPYLSLGAPNGYGGFIKMKKDYIPGLGDTADFALLGASRDTKQPIIPGVKWNRFTFACVSNKEDVVRFGATPVFKILDSLCRPCISEDDVKYICNTAVCSKSSDKDGFDMQYDLRGTVDVGMDVHFSKPFIVELLGSSFVKPPSKGYYSLRHPRITKVHGDRGIEDVTSFEELQEMARKALEVPPDRMSEEAKWMQALEIAGEMKRPVYVTNRSPFSDATTQSTSPPFSTPPISPHPTKSSPMVRIDSCEMLPGEIRNLPPPPGNHHASNLLSSAMVRTVTPPPTSSAKVAEWPTKANETRQKNCNSSSARKRRRKGGDNNSTPLSDGQYAENRSKRRHLSGRTSFWHEASSSQPVKALSEITNVASRETSFGSSGTVFHDAVSENVQPDQPCLPPTGEVIEQPQPLDTFATPGVSGARLAGHSSRKKMQSVAKAFNSLHDRLPSSHVPGGVPRSDTDYKARTRVGDSFYEVREVSRRFQKSWLESSVIYLSPCLTKTPYLMNDLLPRLSPGYTVESLSYWSRQLLYLSPSDPVVSESQAYVGYRKLVLVEAKRVKQTRAVIERIKEIKLCKREGVQIWDWRMAEVLADLQRTEEAEGGVASTSGDEYADLSTNAAAQGLSNNSKTSESQTRDKLIMKLSRRYLGTVTWAHETKENIWIPSDAAARRRATDDLLGFVGVHS